MRAAASLPSRTIERSLIGFPSEQPRAAALPAAVLGGKNLHVLALLRGELLVELALRRSLGHLRAALGEELRRPLLECDRDAEQVRRVLGMALHAGEDRGAVDLEIRGGRRQRRVIPARQGGHVLLLHLRQAAEEIPQLGLGRVAGGALVERQPAELDLEGHPDRIQGPLVLDRAALEQLEPAFAVRAHAVREREPLAHLAAAAAAPAQLDTGTADVGFVAFDRTAAPRAHIHDGRASLGAAGVDGGTKASMSACVIGQACLPPCSHAPIAFAARRPAPIARITVAPPVTMSPPANTPGRLVAWVAVSATM
jgi:hypothetical protein